MFVGMGANGAGGYNLTDSVRFRSSSDAYLSWTPSSAGNRKTWTWSAWVKRGALDSNYQGLFSADTSSNRIYLLFDTDNSLRLDGNAVIIFDTSAVYRDCSAWYHIVLAVDTTQATASNRFKLYVNGTQITSFATDNRSSIAQNTDLLVNNTTIHNIGRDTNTTTRRFDGYMTEVNFVDGQQLTASDFGEYDATTGVWKPKEYTGTYGTNGFYLPMKATTQASGFNTVTYTGSGTSGTKISNVGFQPDLVWVKNRDQVDWHHLFDSVRGVSGGRLASNDTAAEYYDAQQLQSFDVDGYTYGTSHSGNASGEDYVAWCWEAGGTAVSNTTGDIASSVSANTAKGFSVVSYTGTGGTGTVGHGLTSAPKMVIFRPRSVATHWRIWHQGLTGANYTLFFTTGAEQIQTAAFNSTAPTSSVVSLGSDLNTSSTTYIGYCFAEVSGFSKFGSYTGNGSTSGPTITTGFRPAFIMFKRTDSTQNWIMFDNTRDVDGTLSAHLYADLANAEASADTVSINDTGFQIVSTGGTVNTSGGTYIYMAFADTRDYQWNFDASGNKNNWTPNNINSNASSETTYDIMSDVPTLTDESTANFVTLNPINTVGGTVMSEANLKTAYGTSGSSASGTVGANSGKFYAEFKPTSISNNVHVGVFALGNNTNGGNVSPGQLSRCIYRNDGSVFTNITAATYASYTTSNLIGVALDLDASPPTVAFYKDNILQGTINLSTSYSNWTFAVLLNGGTDAIVSNFGQRPFAYTPPTGYKKLNTYNLPDSAIVDGSKYMNTVLWSGNGTSQSITGVGFEPDLVWVKRRDSAGNHAIHDSVRGASGGEYYALFSDSTSAEQLQADGDGLLSLDSDGFGLGYNNSALWNASGGSYVGWAWKGSDSTAVSNTDGTITSTVSANTTSGFSIVTYTGTSTDATIGHGLGKTPDMIIVKSRTITNQNWPVWHNTLSATEILRLDQTAATLTGRNEWNSTLPTSSVFSIKGSNNSVGGTGDYVAYCFAEVEGFSKFGSYTGNSSADGPFIYTGFRPAFVLIKNITTSTQNWYLFDTARDSYNVATHRIFPSLSNAESTSINALDFISNGIKFRDSNNAWNASSNDYIYMAFAENPMKNSLAR